MTAGWPNRDGPAGTYEALRASAGMVPGAVLPVGAGALVGPEGGSPLGMSDDGVRPSPDSPGAQIDREIADLKARVDAFGQGEVGES